MEKIKDLISKNKVSVSIFALIVIITTILAYFLVNIQSQIGVYYWDIFLYLNNSLKMAGMGVGDTLHLPPILPFLTSLLFRAGWVSETAIFTVSAVFYILGVLGMYLLLKLRFNEWESMAGAFSFATFSVVMAWAVSGALDVPSIALAIWALYFTFLAVKKDARFFYLVFPVAMLSFLTRYTSGLILMPILLVIYMNWYSNRDLKKEFKKALIGIGLGLLIYVPFMWYFYRHTGKPFPFLGQFVGTAQGISKTTTPGYNPDLLYYLKNIPNYISSVATPNSYFKIIWPSHSDVTVLAYVILGLILIGIGIYIIKILRDLYNLEKNDSSRKILIIKSCAVILLGIVLLVTYSHISFVFSELLLLVFAVILFSILKDLNLEFIDMDIMFLVWFAAYLIMHSFVLIKVDRYFITMIPPMAFAVALGINQIASLTKTKFKEYNLVSICISVVLVLAMIGSAGVYLSEMPHSEKVTVYETATAQWLIQYDPNYEQKIIASDRGPAFSWYLKKYVQTRIAKRIDPEVFKDLIEELQPDYYISSLGIDPSLLEGYHEIKKIGSVTVYQKN